MVTMATVAKMAGVSPMTVSNVLKGRQSVAPELRARVEQAVNESGYRYNASARTLRAGSSGVIGLAVPGIDAPYFSMLSALIADAARAHGLRVAIEDTHADAAGEQAAVELSRNLAYDGLILTPVGLDDDQWARLAKVMPMVFLGERAAPAGTAHVELPNLAGAREVTELVLDRGARRVAFLSPRTDGEVGTMLGRRHAGFLEALRRAGREASGDLVIRPAGMSTAAARIAVREAWQDGLRPDAIVAVTDSLALGALRGLADLEVPVPDRVQVAGFDDLPESDWSIPSLTTVSPDHRWVARRALELLVERMKNPAAPGVGETAPFTLVERESTRQR